MQVVYSSGAGVDSAKDYNGCSCVHTQNYLQQLLIVTTGVVYPTGEQYNAEETLWMTKAPY